jgi:hypothetical protein
MAGEYPDFVTLAPRLRAKRASAGVGCAGGGTLRDFAGFAYPFLHQNLRAGKISKTIGAEPASWPGMTRRKYAFDWGGQAASAPIVKVQTLGHAFIPPGIHAGGLRNHGAPALAERFRCKCHPRRRERARHPRGYGRSAQVQSDRRKKVIACSLSGHGHLDTPALAFQCQCDGLRGLPPRAIVGLRIPHRKGGRGHDPPAQGSGDGVGQAAEGSQP